ncbi:MAG: glycosyltransferase family 1 protein [Candidatus Woesebacteria bacterium]|nr:glycosyltransferase family 1 protein [Candidatus Woesebacteria bacterium]
MKIAIDISQIVYGTGVSSYTENLVKNLLKIDNKNEYLLFAGTLRRKQDVLRIFPQARVYPIPPTLADFVWNRLHVFPIEKLIGGVDVLHTSDWTEPPSKAFKVTTVHDLYPFKFPRLVHPKILEVHKRKMKWVLKESKMVIVPSNSTKEDLVSLGMDEKRIRVIYEAPSLKKSSPRQVDETKKRYNLQGDYLISIGVTKLKNTENIIKAFHLGSAGQDVKLVLVGRAVGIELEEARNIRILGHVPKEDLGALLTGSRGLIYPSLYEGFGIPILDAFNCEVPVLTSNISSMKEVAGDAAELVDPYDTSSISEGIESILRGPKGFIERGLARVKDFSWEKTTEKTLVVYREAVSKT